MVDCDAEAQRRETSVKTMPPASERSAWGTRRRRRRRGYGGILGGRSGIGRRSVAHVKYEMEEPYVQDAHVATFT